MSNQDNNHDESLARQAQQNLNLNAPSFTPSAPSFTPGAPSFTPAAQSFVPNSQPYYQNQQYQQQHSQYQGHSYGGYQNPYQNNQYQNYQQYQQQPYGQNYQQRQNYNNRGYNNNNNNANFHQNAQQPQQQAYNPPHLRYNPGGNANSGPRNNSNNAGNTANQGSFRPPVSDIKPKVLSLNSDGTASKPKVLSIGADGSASKPKVLSLNADGTASKPKVLSIGSDGTASKPKVLSLSADGSVEKSTSKEAEKSKETETASETPSEVPAISGAEAVAKRAIEKTGEATPAKSGANSPVETSRPATPSESPAEVKNDAVVQEQLEAVDEAAILEMYGKEHLNVIFLGHVDAGKSTLGGSILVSTGVVDQRTLEKYRREAKDSGNESWYLSWVMDQNKEERADGKTIEVGQGFFETDDRRFTILDAPGHKSYVSNMIGGASQADIGVLVISARKGEYETGFEKGGQTREHALLAKTQGVNKLVIAVNKMDDPTVEWSEERYKQCILKPTTFLKGIGYNPSTDLTFIPVAGQSSQNIKDRVDSKVCSWYNGPSLLEVLNTLNLPDRKINAPLMMPITLKMKDMGTVLRGKIEAGVMKKDQKYCIMPNKTTVTVTSIKGETEQEIDQAICGDQVQINVRGVDEEDVKVGHVLCSLSHPVHAVRGIEAHIMLLEVKSILVAGYQCVMHIHTSTEPVYFDALLHKLQKGTNRRSKNPPAFAVKGMNIIARLVVQDPNSRICVERFEDYNQLGRFTLRDQDQTIAIGKVTKLLTDF